MSGRREGGLKLSLTGENVLAAGKPASAAHRLYLQSPQSHRLLLRGSALRFAFAMYRRPAGEELDLRRDHRGIQRDACKGRGERPPKQLPARGAPPDRARAGRRQTTPVGREAATRRPRR